MVIEPETDQALAAALKDASEHNQTVVIRGAGTKNDWGRTGPRADVVIEMRRLNRVLAHQHGDLTATVEAGATLREVNETLARHGQWLPLDPPFADRATIGGILATNDSGPLRHRYGTPRDLVIGVRLATTDGTVAKAGGQVVKNVAGYDLSKLVTGSFGSLAAIVSATFKLAPLPRATKTIVISTSDLETLGEVVRAVMSSQLEPIAFEVHVRSTQNAQNAQSDIGGEGSARESSFRNVGELGAVADVAQPFPSPVAPDTSELRRDAPKRQRREGGRPARVLLRFGSIAAAVDAQIDQALALAALKGCATVVVEPDRERTLWREHAEGIWSAPGAIVRASWLPADVTGAVAALKGCATAPAAVAHSAPGFELEMIGRAGLGAGLIRIDGDDGEQASAIARLRASTHFGNVVIVRGSDALKASVDVWAPQGGRERLFAALKHALDPNGVLNPGRGPL
jgi:FAD/FMN-containing dehydrogenase